MVRLNESSLRKLCLAGVISTLDYWEYVRNRRNSNRKHNRLCTYVRKPFILSKYTDDESVMFFRFSKFQIRKLVHLLKIPKTFSVHKSKCTDIEGMCILLRRLSDPNRLCDLVKMFARDISTISRIANFMLKLIYVQNRFRVQSLNQNWLLSRLDEFARVIVVLKQALIGFIDGTARPICRPAYRQKDLYSGYKKQHVVKYQSVVLPNGLIGRLDGPFIGRRHDAAIFHLSNLRKEMEDYLNTPTGSYALYGDPGYSNSKYIKVGYKTQATLNERQKLFNHHMSALRVSVEYGFGKLLQLFAFVDYKKNQKLYLQHVKMQYYVAALFVNCHICMNGSQVGDFFQCLPPTIEEYLE